MINYEKQNTLNDSELEGVAGGMGVENSAAQNCGVLPEIPGRMTAASLKPLKEKMISAINDTNTDVDRESIQKEIEASVQQIDDNALVTFNGKKLNDR